MIEKTYYIQPIEYIISHYIHEYDMSKANISVLYNEGILSEQDYNTYYNMPKSIRQIKLGYMRKDKEFDRILSDSIAKYRKMFIESNGIEDSQILSIKNDALFLIDKEADIVEFGHVKFIKKNTYTSFFKLNRLEVYYNLDLITDKEVIDVKGMGDKQLELHIDYFANFLCNVFEFFLTKPIDEVIDYIKTFYNSYMKRSLNINYYREFDADSQFSVHSKTKFFKFDMIDKIYVDRLDISCNMNIIRTLYGIASSIYLNNRR